MGEYPVYGRILSIWENTQYMGEYSVYERILSIWENPKKMGEYSVYGRMPNSIESIVSVLHGELCDGTVSPVPE